MKTPKAQKQVVVGNNEHIPKELNNSTCCGPTCCSSSNKKETNKKEK
jgi:hypothetical protein